MYINDGWLFGFVAVAAFVAFSQIAGKVEAAQIRKAIAEREARKEAQ